MTDKKAAAKQCKRCGKPIPFPGWFLSKNKLCAVCNAKDKLAQEKGRK
jgi:NMD protein affecting ribosome stability and mRNA decay